MGKGEQMWIRPLAMDFPGDRTAVLSNTQWMDGDLLVAPIYNRDAKQRIYLPEGTWYEFNQSQSHVGPKLINKKFEAMAMPAFVQPGKIIVLAQNVVQHTDQLPGGALEVQIYKGADGSFKLVEDDGESIAYEVDSVRETTFRWYDAACMLSWRARGAKTGNNFQTLVVTIFDSDNNSKGTPLRLEETEIKDGGSLPCPVVKE